MTKCPQKGGARFKTYTEECANARALKRHKQAPPRLLGCK